MTKEKLPLYEFIHEELQTRIYTFDDRKPVEKSSDKEISFKNKLLNMLKK